MENFLVIGTYQCNKNLSKLIRFAFYNAHINCVDTAPSYNNEFKVAKCVNELLKEGIKRDDYKFMSKIDGIEMEKCKGNVYNYIKNKLRKMKIDYYDYLFVHWPFEKYFNETYMCLQRLKEDGYIKKIGLCNVDKRFIDSHFSNLNVFPDAIQNEISPLNFNKQDIDYFKKNNVEVFAYSSLCRMDSKIVNNSILKELCAKYDCTIPQLVFAWEVLNGINPIFTSHKTERIKQNSDIKDIKLEEEDIIKINSINENYKLFPYSFGCPDD